jgi:integrase
MNYETLPARRIVSDIELPAKVKIVDTGKFVLVNLDEMLITGDIGNWTLRLKNLSKHLSAETSAALHFAILHALNGRRKVSTLTKWVNELRLFIRSTYRKSDPPIHVITLKMFNQYVATKGASQQKLLRSVLLYWSKSKIHGISSDLSDYLALSKSPKPRHTSEIQITNPQERPLPIGEVRAILAQVDELYISGLFDAQDNLLWRLIVSLGLRPTQIKLLRTGDVRYEIEERTKEVHAFLNIPIVKQHATPARSYMMEYRMSEAVTAAFQQHLEFLELTLGHSPQPTQPLFSIIQRGFGDRAAKDTAIDISNRINITRKRIAKSLPAIEDTDLFTRRFKHTKLTHLAVLGAPLPVLARAGYQTSTISLRHYVNLDEEAYMDYEDRLDDHNQEVHNAFKGRIVEPSEATNRDPHHAILSPDLDDSLGDCAGDPCDVFAPIGCYVCPRFEAFTDGAHSSVLKFLERKMAAAQKLNLSAESTKRDAHLIAAVKFVISEIENNASIS